MVTALAPTLLVIVALTATMFVTVQAGVVIAGGAVLALLAFYLLRPGLPRRFPRWDLAAARSRAATGDVPKVTGHSWPVNSPHPGLADQAKECVR
jgi:hypothetical protein